MAQEQQEKYYSFKVGNSRPDAVEYGRVNKDGTPKGPTKKGFAQVGIHGIPNSSEVWGKPKLNKDQKRTGEIEFLPWGHKDGQVVSIRYLRSTSSIDRMFQDQNGLKPGPEDIELVFQTGINKVSRRDNPALVLMLENHSLNEDSVSRSPDIEVFFFRNYDAKAEVAEKTKARESKLQAAQFVLDASRVDGGVEVLASIFNKDLQIETSELADLMFDEADQDPEGFLEHISKFKESIEARIIEAEELEVIDLGHSGEILIYSEGAKESMKVDPSFDRDKKVNYLKNLSTTVSGYKLLDAITENVRAAKENINV